MASEVFGWLLRSTLALSIAIALVMALRPLWRRWLGAGSVLWLWLLLPAALVATSLPRPTVVVEQPQVAALQAPAPVSEAGGMLALPLSVVAETTAAPAASTASGAPVERSRIVLATWLFGALVLAHLLYRQQRAFRRRLGALRPRGDGSYLASSVRVGPAVVGALRPRIVVPADFEQRYDPQQRILVLAHERVHLQRGDLQVNLLLCALRCLFWFNPLVHLASSRLRLDQELACDAVVLRIHPDAGRAYAAALLNTQLADLGLPVGCYWQSSHPLKWRISLLRQRSPGRVRLLLGTVFAVLASSAGAATLWVAQPVNTLVLPAAAVPSLLSVAPAELEIDLDQVRVEAPDVHAGEPLVIEPLIEAAPVASVLDVMPAAVAAAKPVTAAAPAPALPPAPVAEAATVAATAVAVQATAPPADDGLVPPRVIESPAPSWPMRGRRVDIERGGLVIVQVEVDAQGNPVDPKVWKSEMGRAYQGNAVKAVKRWTFEPAMRNGQAVATTILVPVVYDATQVRTRYLGANSIEPLALQGKLPPPQPVPAVQATQVDLGGN